VVDAIRFDMLLHLSVNLINKIGGADEAYKSKNENCPGLLPNSYTNLDAR